MVVKLNTNMFTFRLKVITQIYSGDEQNVRLFSLSTLYWIVPKCFVASGTGGSTFLVR